MDNPENPQELLNIWTKGKSLDIALWDFCSLREKSEYQNNYSEKDRTDNISLGSGFISILKNISHEAEKLTQHEILKNKLCTNLFNKLKKGQLIALGYKSPMKLSDFPIRLPLHMWPPKNVDFKESSISKNGLTFKAVRIIKKIHLRKSLSPKRIKLPEIEIGGKKGGRPTIKDKIITAYERLEEAGKIDFSKSLKAHIKLIQATVRAFFPEIKGDYGMTYEVIRRTLGKRFLKDKETSKPTSKL